MKDADRSLVQVAAEQRQVFTRSQAQSAGLTSSDIAYRVRSGLFTACGPHTLKFAGTILDYRGQLTAGLLDLGAAALVSGRAAAALYQLDGFPDGPLEYLVPRAMRGRRANGPVTSTGSIGRLDRATVDGLAVTSGTRTVIELVGQVTERELGNAIDSATRAGLTAPVVLRRRLQQLGRRGRRGVRVFDRIMESAGVQSWLERDFLRLVLSVGFSRPAVQRVHRRDGRHVARVDFDFDPVPVVVEVGGRRGYMSSDDRRRQEHRRNELQLLGKTVYFFTTEDVSDAGEYVIETLRHGLALAA